jgi:hypothetical protein
MNWYDRWQDGAEAIDGTAYDLRTVGLAMLFVFVVIAGISAFLIARIPYDPDLYATLYGPIRPRRPEGTYTFLLIAPAMILLPALPLALAPRRFVRTRLRSRDEFLALAALLACHTAGWALAALVRDRAVLNYYFG